MPGLFSSLMNKAAAYATGARLGVMGAKAGGKASLAMGAGYNAGQLGRYAWNSMSRTAKGAAAGALAGGAYGAVSDDTSVLGGMAMGAGLGAAGARYVGAGMLSNKGSQGFMAGVANMAKKDFRNMRTTMTSAYNRRYGQGIPGPKSPAAKASNRHAAQAQRRAAAAPTGATMRSNNAGKSRRVPPGIRRMRNLQEFENMLPKRGLLSGIPSSRIRTL